MTLPEVLRQVCHTSGGNDTGAGIYVWPAAYAAAGSTVKVPADNFSSMEVKNRTRNFAPFDGEHCRLQVHTYASTNPSKSRLCTH